MHQQWALVATVLWIEGVTVSAEELRMTPARHTQAVVARFRL